MSKVSARLLLVFFATLLASCGTKDKGPQKYFVAFSQCNSAEPYRAAQNQRMQESFGKKADVQLAISDAQQDNSKQIAQIEAFIRQKPDLLIVAPNERAPLANVMGRAIARAHSGDLPGARYFGTELHHVCRRG